MRAGRSALAKLLLASGAGHALVYVIENDGVAARRCAGYSRRPQAVSELSAKGSPARPFLVATVPLTSALMVASGIGVWRAAEGGRALRMTGGLLVAHGLTGVMWLPFPMTARQELAEGAAAVNDVGHLVLSAATAILVLSQMGTGAMALGRRFGAYSVCSAATCVGFGAITGERCLACWNCTLGCPTCFCSDVRDTTDSAWRWRPGYRSREGRPGYRSRQVGIAARATRPAPSPSSS